MCCILHLIFTNSYRSEQRSLCTPVQVQTNGKKTPILVVQNALQDLGDEVQDIRSKFQSELNKFQGGPPQY